MKRRVFAGWQKLSPSRYQPLVAGSGLTSRRLSDKDFVRFQVNRLFEHISATCVINHEIERLVIAGFGRY
jgi:hypothetical protein